MQPEPVITANNLFKQYRLGGNTIDALRGVCVSIAQGKLTILRGRSGSGKTTLLNQLCLLDRPNSGEVVINGEDVTGFPDKWRDGYRRKNYGIIFQSIALMPHMTALENVDFAMRVSGAKISGRMQRASECLAMVGLTNRASHLPQEMSGGEQQRTAIARAIAHKPHVLFADEPTAELDTQTGLQVIKVFLDLIENEGITVVMTTHDPALMEFGYKVYTLQDGEITDE